MIEVPEPSTAASMGVRIIDPGQLRVGNTTVKMTEEEPKIVGRPVVEVRADTWQHWLRVATGRAGLARTARERT